MAMENIDRILHPRAQPALRVWFKSRMLRGPIWWPVLWLSITIGACSSGVSVASHLLFHEPLDRLWITASFGLGVPLLVAPPAVWLMVWLLREAESARSTAVRLSITDPLTHAFNRRYFFRAGELMLGEADEQETGAAVLLLDIDHFKSVNDRHGHATGDQVLVQVCDACRGCLRAQDVLARLGGEEFGILLHRTSLGVAMDIAERLRSAVANLSIETESGAILHATVSIGVVATRHLPTRGLDELLAAADHAMYSAKQTGRNRVCQSPRMA